MEVADLEDDVEGLETRIQKIKSELDDLEDDIVTRKNLIKEAQSNIKKYETQLNEVKNNREYDAISKEIEIQGLDIQVSEKKIKERPDEVKRVIKAGLKANRYIRQNRDGTIQSWMEWMKVDKEMATATYDSVGKAFNEDGSLPEAGLRLLIDEAKKAAKISREIASSEVVDLSILREAQKELGIQGK